jgi:uncharacterized membrane protein
MIIRNIHLVNGKGNATFFLAQNQLGWLGIQINVGD